MNNKGQTLIIFVIFLPILLALCALIIDIGLLTNAKIKLENTTTMILKDYYDLRLEENITTLIKESLEKNKIQIHKLEVITSEEELKIVIKSKKASIFGKIIGFQEYEIATTKIAKKRNDLLSIRKE